MVVAIKLYVFASLCDHFQVKRENFISIHRDSWLNADELKNHLLNQLETISQSNKLDKLKEQQAIDPRTIMLAINEVLVDSSDGQIALFNNDIVALIPPVSGG